MTPHSFFTTETRRKQKSEINMDKWNKQDAIKREAEYPAHPQLSLYKSSSPCLCVSVVDY